LYGSTAESKLNAVARGERTLQHPAPQRMARKATAGNSIDTKNTKN
jgi:hypothetical protein